MNWLLKLFRPSPPKRSTSLNRFAFSNKYDFEPGGVTYTDTISIYEIYQSGVDKDYYVVKRANDNHYYSFKRDTKGDNENIINDLRAAVDIYFQSR